MIKRRTIIGALAALLVFLGVPCSAFCEQGTSAETPVKQADARDYLRKAYVYGGDGRDVSKAKGAIDILSEGIKLHPDDSKLYMARAFLRTVVMDWRGVWEDFSKVIELEPNNYDALIERAKLSIQGRKYKQAIVDLNKAHELKPQSAFALFLRGRAYAGLESYNLALKDLNKAAEIAPKQPAIFYRRSSVKHRLGDKEGAREDSVYAEKINEELRPKVEKNQEKSGELEQAPPLGNGAGLLGPASLAHHQTTP